MTELINRDVVWLNVSPGLRWVHQPILRVLSQCCPITQWDYQQTEDEACSLDLAVELLHRYVKKRLQIQRLKHPANLRSPGVNLVGHGLSGVVGLLYARKFPQFVQSLTLLSVAAQPATLWDAHYYVKRLLLPYARHPLLAQTAAQLWEGPHRERLPFLVTALEKDLSHAPSPHTFLKLVRLAPGGVAVPLLVCGSHTDPVVSPAELADWQVWLKPSDQLWICPEGRHFFHYAYPHRVADRLLHFWRSLSAQSQVQHQSRPNPQSLSILEY